jgi:hypothetical protein
MQSRASILPLAFNHERHLVMEEVQALLGRVPTGGRLPLLFRFAGNVERERVEKALNGVIRRHSALNSAYTPNARYDPADRTRQLRFFAQTGLFVPGLYVHYAATDARVAVHERQLVCDNDLEGLVRQELTTPLNTDTGPLIRATLATAPGSTYLVLIITHHTLDGWSVALLAREFSTLYTVPSAELPEVDLQCHDFASWQLRQFSDRRFANAERYWHQQWAQLGDAQIQPSDVPFASTDVGTHQTGAISALRTISFSLDESTCIRVMLARLHLTAYVLFRTAMTLVLHCYTGKHRLAFWANFANRRYPEFLPAMAWCANTHIVTTEIDRTMTCFAMTQRVAAAVRQAQAHEELPLPALWQRLGRNLDTHRTRVCFDMFPGQRRTDSACVEPILSSVGAPGMDLDLRLWDDITSLSLVATYNPERYRVAGIDAMLASIRNVVLAFAAAPDLQVAECEALMKTADSELPQI